MSRQTRFKSLERGPLAQALRRGATPRLAELKTPTLGVVVFTCIGALECNFECFVRDKNFKQ